MAVALALAALLPGAARAGCWSPLPNPDLQTLEDQVDSDPVGASLEIRRRIDALRDSDALKAAELYALAADAYDAQDDDERVRAAVKEGRARLLHAPDGEQKRALLVRFDVMEADSPRTVADMTASIDQLSRIEKQMPAGSVDRACLLIVRSRLNTQLNRDDEATADGIAAYRLATALNAPAAAADAAYQLAMTYLRAGLLEDAASLADQAAAYRRSRGQAALLSNALYIKADILAQMHRYDEALAVISDARALNLGLRQDVDVAFDDQKKCAIELAIFRLDAAERSCLDARRVLAKADRADMIAIIEGNLARIDILRGHPGAAIARLNGVLRSAPERIPLKTMPTLYRSRADALIDLGRFREAVRDLKEASRLADMNDQERRNLAAERLKERMTQERIDNERNALAVELSAERQDAANQARQFRVRIALMSAIGLLFISIAYLMWNRARRERELREAAESLDAQAQVISTIGEGVLLVDGNDRIKYANPAISRLLDRPSNKVLGCSIEELGIPVDFIRAAPGGNLGLPEGVRELQLADARGRPLVVLLTHSRVSLRQEALTICVLQDVTETRRLERAVLLDASGERGQMSIEIHEGIAQDLTGIALLLGSIARDANADISVVETALQHINDVIVRARMFARGLSPVQVAGGSLPTALSRLAEEESRARGVSIACRCDMGALGLNPAQSDHVYGIAKRCVGLASRDGNTLAAMELRATGDALILTVTPGRAPAAAPFQGAERDWATVAYLARVMGGTARVESLPDRRICMIIEIPAARLLDGAPSPERREDDSPLPA